MFLLNETVLINLFQVDTNQTNVSLRNYKETSLLDLSSYILPFSYFYSQIHGWLSLFVCVIGIPLNIIDIFILKKTKVATYTTNSILILISSMDTIIMIFYVPFSVHYYIQYTSPYLSELLPERDNFYWTCYSILNTYISITFHSISIWLTVYLAIYRQVTLKKSLQRLSKKQKNITIYSNYYTKFTYYLLSNSKMAMALISLFCVLFCIPIYLFPSIKKEIYQNMSSQNQNATLTNRDYIYFVDQSDFNIYSKGLVFKLSFYFQAILGKLIPSVLLIVFIYSVIKMMSEIKENKRKLCASIKVKQKK